jgi:hypothetical protein
MSRKHYPPIKVGASKFEILLLRSHTAFFLLAFTYFIASWNSISGSISLINKAGELYYIPKLQYFLLSMVFLLPLISWHFSVYFWRNDQNDEFSPSVSSNLLKAIKLYKIRRCCLCCTLTLVQLFFSIGIIGEIENQLGHISIALKNNLSLIPLSLIIVNWLIHYILWIRLSD